MSRKSWVEKSILFVNFLLRSADLSPCEEVEVTEAGHDEDRRGQQGVESPGCLLRHPVLQPPVGGLGGDSPGHALQCDAQEVEEGPDEDKVHGAVPHVHEGEADGAAEQLEDEARGQGGDDREVDVAETGKGSE